MARLSASLPIALLLAAGAPIVSAQTPSLAPFHGRYSELKGKTFTEEPFSISVIDYVRGFGFGFTFRVTNTGNSLASFELGDLAIVGADGNQPIASTTVIYPLYNLTVARTVILPGAHIVRGIDYDYVNYPAKLYYKGRLLAEFTK